MNSQTSLARYILVVLCISIVFTTLVLIALNAWTTNNKLSWISSSIPAVDQVLTGQSYEDGYKDGYNAAREKLKTVAYLPEGTPVLSFRGSVEAVMNDSIMVNAETLDTDEIVDGISDSRMVYIASTTKIVLREVQTFEEQQKTLQEWQNNGAKTGEPPPQTFKDAQTTLEDIDIDDQVYILALEDIRLAESFTASEVIIIQ